MPREMPTRFETFSIEETEIEKLVAWNGEHNKTCKAGNKFIKFSSSTGIGQNIFVKCSCGVEVDITDYSQW